MYREKIVSWKALKKELKNWQKQGLKIVFTKMDALIFYTLAMSVI